jgi:tight adherence protein B
MVSEILGDDLAIYGLAVVIAIALATVMYFVMMPYLSGQKRTDQRVQDIAEAKRRTSTSSKSNAESASTNNRKRQVADTLKSLDDRKKAREKVSLRIKLLRAGLDVSPQAFWMGSVGCGVLCAILAFFSGPTGSSAEVTILVPIAALIVGTLGIPRWVVSRMTKRRQGKFTAEFANAIDVIVRGVKSGLPLNECLGIIARESPDPINGEFRELVEQQRVGIPLADAFERMMVRLPMPEVRFFAIVIAIQQQAGGNLSEALGNLSGVLRDRKRLSAKVQALSAEAKASAGVLASLPFIVMVLTYISSPTYIAILWTTKMGQFLLLVSAVWMTIGVLVMKKMINFKY